MDNKLVVIVNGKGGAGKDTLCGYFCRFFGGQIASSITPIKKMAKRLGWRGEKEDADRLFLSDLKIILDRRFGTSRQYLSDVLKQFGSNADKRILFVMIREPDDIEAFKKEAIFAGYRVKTLLIRRSSINDKDYGNMADDNVENYHYDYIFDNSHSLEESHRDFVVLIRHMAEAEEE